MYSPTVAHHTHSLGLSHAIELGALLQVLFASDSLSVAETSLSKGINITPGYNIVKSEPDVGDMDTHYQQFQSNARLAPCLARYPSHSYD